MRHYAWLKSRTATVIALTVTAISGALGVSDTAGQVGAGDATGVEAAREILRRAFDNLYDFDMTTTLTLSLHNKRGEQSVRRAEIARKRIDGRLHAFARFVDPPWMRGTAVLVIDNQDRSDDHFLFLPDQGRVRRVTNVQRTDAFLGSDLWYEDLERRHAEDYEVASLRWDDFKGEAVFVVSAYPTTHSGYGRVEFIIARSDHLLVKTSFYKGRAERPFKTIEAPSRAAVVEKDGHVIPVRLIVSNLQRGTRTEARFERLEVNPEISDHLFTSTALESGRAIPGRAER
jgi:hypothetical protein